MSDLFMLKPVPLWSVPSDLESVDLDDKLSELLRNLVAINDEFERVAVASSLAAEDMVLTHAILTHPDELLTHWKIFILNTGRLHTETLALLGDIKQRYHNELASYEPERVSLHNYIEHHGENAFYESVEQRKRCCEIRKVEPLDRALASSDAWLTGQRQEQSVTRQSLPLREQDQQRGIVKFNLLSAWSERDVWAYIKRFDVPVNRLYQRGYPSIGCEPCTRAVKLGEDSRAGRWWWEQQDTKECGLHAQNIQS